MRGEWDEGMSWPAEKVVTVGDFKVAVTHGHTLVPAGDVEALGAERRRLGADVLVTGHTHRHSAEEHEGGLLLNPGSATGAYSATAPGVRPSFLLLDVQDSQLTVFIYQLAEDGEVKVEKVVHRKA